MRGLHLLRIAGALLGHFDLGQVALAAAHIVAALADITGNADVFHIYHLTALSMARRQHKTPKGSLCPECRQLHDYALTRIDKCPFMETKTFCSACRVHCYQPAMREKIRTVMRWAGPRMLPVHPVLSIRHVAVTLRSKREAKKAG